jgi:hypothetical protein
VMDAYHVEPTQSVGIRSKSVMAMLAVHSEAALSRKNLFVFWVKCLNSHARNFALCETLFDYMMLFVRVQL